MSYRAGLDRHRTLLITLWMALFTLPVFSAERWVAVGPADVHVSAIRADYSDPQRLYLASDRGVFVSRDGGSRWNQVNSGLHDSAVLALEQATNGTWVAGTSHGIFLLLPNATVWRPSIAVVNERGTPRVIHVNGLTRRVMSHHATRAVLQARINDIEIAPNRWLAATSAGIFSSSDQGRIWSGGPVNGEKEFIAIRAEKELVAAATRTKLLVSTDGGTVWKQARLRSLATTIYAILIARNSQILAATQDGLFSSFNGAAGWEHLSNGIPAEEIGSVAFDSTRNRLLVYSNRSGRVFESTDKGQSWRAVSDAGTGIQNISTINGRLFASTGNAILAGPVKPQDDLTEANRGRGNWFMRLVRHSQ